MPPLSNSAHPREAVPSSRWPIQPRRDALFAALTVFVAFSIAVLFAWRSSMRQQSERILEDVRATAEAAARLLYRDMYTLTDMRCDGQDAMLEAEARRLEFLRSTQPRLAGLYLLVPDGDALALGIRGGGEADSHEHAPQPAAYLARETKSSRTSDEYETERGRIVSVYAPLLDQAGNVAGIVGADVPTRVLRDFGGASEEVLLYGSLFTVVCMIGMAGLVYRLRSNMRDVMIAQETRVVALERSAEALSRAQEHAGTVLASMSHEVRTPLTAILGFTELLLEPSDDVDVLRRHAQTIRRNSQHLLGVLNDALDMSKIDAGMMRIHRQPFDPRRLVNEVVELFVPRAKEKGVALESDISDLPEYVDTDEQRVRQILLNLLSNGLKFTERGEVVVSVSYDHTHGMLKFQVRDTGIGISPEHVDSIFRPYQQAVNEDVRRFGGTGLGLAISKRLAELLAGHLTVASRPGHGATFTLALPAPVVEAREVVQREKHSPSEAWKPRPSWHVLLVEDTLEHQKILYAVLRRAGHTVEVCETGERAVKLVREAEYVREPYTLIVLDAHLGSMSGAATARAVREHGFRGPIVGVTADEAESTRLELLAGGCNDVLTKPIERDLFIALLSRLLHEMPSAGAA